MSMTKIEQAALNKVEGFKLYRVLSREWVWYEKEIWAKSENEAKDLMEDSLANKDAIEYSDYECVSVKENEDGIS